MFDEVYESSKLSSSESHNCIADGSQEEQNLSNIRPQPPSTHTQGLVGADADEGVGVVSTVRKRVAAVVASARAAAPPAGVGEDGISVGGDSSGHGLVSRETVELCDFRAVPWNLSRNGEDLNGCSGETEESELKLHGEGLFFFLDVK